MNLIHQNPYRIAGILAGVSERELKKQQSKLKAFAKVGKEANLEVDFPFLHKVSRNESAVANAIAAIEQGRDRVDNALFWFVNGNKFDEIAIDHLLKGDAIKALEIYGKIVTGREVSATNFTSFNNYATLLILEGIEPTVKKGVEAKVKLIESDHFSAFVELVADKTVSTNPQEYVQRWLEKLTGAEGFPALADKMGKLTSGLSSNIRKIFSDRQSADAIHALEVRIAQTVKKRKQSPASAYQLGKKLYQGSRADVRAIGEILDRNGLKYQAAVDGLANEIMQCGIDYFKDGKEQSRVPEECLELLGYAGKLAVGQQTKDRVKENSEGVEEYQVMGPIEAQTAKIAELLSRATSSRHTIVSVNHFVSAAQPHIMAMKEKVGTEHPGHIQWSSLVVQVTISLLVDVVNNAQEGLRNNQQKIAALPGTIDGAVNILTRLKNMTMDAPAAKRFVENYAALSELQTTIKRALAQRNSSSGGCYVATMAYGSYEHPQVLKLRWFRDQYLSSSVPGRWFIKTYYRYSPSLVNRLKGHERINVAVRACLDRLITIFE